MIRLTTLPSDQLAAYKENTTLPLSLNNARELGGCPVGGGKHVKRGLLLRTTQLCDATEADLALLQDRYRLSLILDMRNEDEILRGPDPDIPGARWVHTPVIDFELMKKNIAAAFQGHMEDLPKIDPVHPDPEKVVDMMIIMMRKGMEDHPDQGFGSYADYLDGDLGRRNFGLFFHEIAKTEQGAVLWHCLTGKDRTGIAAGLLLDIFGADWNTILTDYEVSNLYFADNIARTEAMLQARGLEEELIVRMCSVMAGVHADMLKAAWDFMRKAYGGARGYLTEGCGVTEEELRDICLRYTE